MSEKRAKISIIIPIYNCEEYLEQCIRSVLCQTLKELEIICVDDGSTDRTVEIIRRLQTTDNRIMLFCQKNQGAGAARNFALKNAHGIYVAFLDADDYYKAETALEVMYNTCEENNISICSSARRCIKTDIEKIVEMFSGDYKGTIFNYKDYQMDYFFQNYLFLRELLIENDIFFPPYRRYQDPPFLVRALFKAEKFVVSNTCLYCYRINDHMEKFDKVKTEDLLRGLIDNLEFADQKNLDILFDNTAERLEKDFVKVIYEYISPEDLQILELLLRINRIIADKYQQNNYIIKPLKVLLFNFISYEKELLRSIEKQGKIAIFGAGKYASNFLKFLKKNDLLNKVEFAIVSDTSNNLGQIEMVSIISLEEYLELNKNLELLITVNQQNMREIVSILEKKGYRNYKVLDDLFWEFRVLEDFGD